jgi:hypothetical protein
MAFQPRLDGRTIDQRKADFLDQYRQSGNIYLACKLARIGRSTVYGWEKADPDFAAAWEVAEVEATEFLEAEAFRRAVKGVKQKKGVYYLGKPIAYEVETSYSDTLLLALMRARAPEKYRDRKDVRHSGPGGGPMEFLNLKDLTDEDFERLYALANKARQAAITPE